jgi:hypothetical protein
MTESETDDRLQPPVVTGESMIPPTEVNWTVEKKSGFVNLHLTSHDRSIGHLFMVNPQEAEEVAKRLRTVADEIEQTDNH